MDFSVPGEAGFVALFWLSTLLAEAGSDVTLISSRAAWPVSKCSLSSRIVKRFVMGGARCPDLLAPYGRRPSGAVPLQLVF